MRLLFLSFTALLSLFLTSVNGFNPEDLERLKGSGECIKCDLTKAEMIGIKLVGANLGSSNSVSYTHLTLPTIYSV